MKMLKKLSKLFVIFTMLVMSACGTQPAWADEYVMDLPKEVECLGVAIYHESRALTFNGMVHVANVIMNRVESSKYPNTVCEVVAQNRQFSYYGQGKPETLYDILYAARSNPTQYDFDSFGVSIDIAHSVYNGLVRPLNKTVLYYHTEDVDPEWNDEMTLVALVDGHEFYEN